MVPESQQQQNVLHHRLCVTHVHMIIPPNPKYYHLDTLRTTYMKSSQSVTMFCSVMDVPPLSRSLYA